MFSSEEYIARRRRLCEHLHYYYGSGLVLFLGNSDMPINYLHNTYWFRQDASFSYFFGLDRPGLAAVIDLELETTVLFGDDPSMDDIIWTGEQTPLCEQAVKVGVTETQSVVRLPDVITAARDLKRTIHILPPYRGEAILTLAKLFSCAPAEITTFFSLLLVRAVIHLREIKSEAEVMEIERALTVTKDMHLAAMRLTKPGTMEHTVVGAMEGIVRGHNLQTAYPIIFSRRGDVLHNRDHHQRLEAGDLVINDAGASSALGYASDITRTLPVGGQFTDDQRRLYELVLRAQQVSIDVIQPGVTYIDVHKFAAKTLMEGMVELGFFKDIAEEVVRIGAYAICFPHGLGHAMGLDVHDMESLGENHVGYDDSACRSPLFGMHNLRLGKMLKAGMVITVEPGLYFIPQLIEQWKAEQRHAHIIDYARFDAYLKSSAHVRGIRIEDDVLVTAKGARVLSQAIPKTCAEVEAAMAT